MPVFQSWVGSQEIQGPSVVPADNRDIHPCEVRIHGDEEPAAIKILPVRAETG